MIAEWNNHKVVNDLIWSDNLKSKWKKLFSSFILEFIVAEIKLAYVDKF